MNKNKYIVYIDDNFHHMDEDERYKAGEFDDCESARKFCMGIVDGFLINAYEPGMDWNTLLNGYKGFGEDPWISTLDADCRFSAWDYAEQRCLALCTGKDD
jgi:hypothetical protein